MNNIPPIITIIVPVYNTATHLRTCIDSIVSQTVPDWELILINDGSTDASGSICDEYATKDSRIAVVHQQNSGVSNARNKGIELAKGNFITFIDSDDWIELNFIEKFKNLIVNKNTLIVYGIAYDFIDSQQNFQFIPSHDEILLH